MNLDPLNIIMISLVLFVGIIVMLFASRYLEGDTNRSRTLCLFGTLIAAAVGLFATDNLFIFLILLCITYALLVLLMIHRFDWKEARAAGTLAAAYLFSGTLLIGAAFGLFFSSTGSSSMRLISESTGSHSAALLLLTLGVVIQSAGWPFHRWLISSLNSPTPTSAIMHAGIINGGGYLLARFGALYLEEPFMLKLLFISGVVTAFLGTLWKLMQPSIKGMLACSTMGQMGFMVAQCGLGLFPAAVAHLCLHGLFKANAFLGSASAVRTSNRKDPIAPTITSWVIAAIGGCGGSLAFALISEKEWFPMDTTLVLVAVAFTMTAQLTRSSLYLGTIPAIAIGIGAGAIYGTAVELVSLYLAPLNLWHPQSLDFIYLAGLAFFMGSWLMPTLAISTDALYVQAVNRSQPHPSTVTTEVPCKH